MKLPGHPSTHGHHVNPYTCRRNLHRHCDGFSGDYDTYQCGCCCHDAYSELTDDERKWIRRVLGAGGGSR